MEINKIYNGNCLEVLKSFPDNSVDSVVTDPPYGISFMNKHWDYDVPKVEVWQEIYRVLKQGGHVLCACGTRTQHRMAVNIEDAGFEIRDVITWHYGSGFPKSLNVAIAIEKQIGGMGARGKAFVTAGAGSREDIQNTSGWEENKSVDYKTDEAKEWDGWGTALKPATEFWTLARKPLGEKTVAENVLKYDTGGINIDGSRIETSENVIPSIRDTASSSDGWKRPWMEDKDKDTKRQEDAYEKLNSIGRFPANVIFDEFTGKILDEQSIAAGIHSAGIGRTKMVQSDYNASSYDFSGERQMNRYEDDSIGASRFFYCPKADNYERNKGLKGFDKGQPPASARSKAAEGRENALGNPRANHHPTVKPIDLMRYLVKLITPKKGICLDPYCGSGTTLIGCKMELINYIGIEREEEYCKIAEARVAAWNPDKYKPQQLF